MKTIARREFLAGTGAAAAVALAPPFLRRALGAATPPRRLLVFFMANSGVRTSWACSGGRDVAAGTGDASAFSLGRTSEPFGLVRDHLTMLEGVDNWASGLNLHTSPTLSFMTGRAVGPGVPGFSKFVQLATGPSIDQILARDSAVLRDAPVRSVELSCHMRGDRDEPQGRAMTYDFNANQIVPENRPHAAYLRLLSSASGGTVDPAALEAARARDRSALDFVLGDLKRLNGRLPASERQKLDGHLAALVELERSLNRPAAIGAATITVPSGLEMLQPNRSENYKPTLDAFLELVKLVFRLDLSRVVTFMFSAAESHVDLSKSIAGMPSGEVHPMTHGGNTDDRPNVNAVTTFYAQTVAKFASTLAAIPDAGGGNMLSNTLIVFFTDCGSGPKHTQHDAPLALIGGSSLGVRGNRCLRYDQRYCHDLWTAVAKAFGVNLPTFGAPDRNKGPLPELVA